METVEQFLKPLRETAEILGCTDKTLRNYIKAGELSFQEVDSPYGKTYLVDPDEARKLYEEKSSRGKSRNNGASSHVSSAEPSTVKEVLEALEVYREDYKAAMETVVKMSFELGNAEKEIKLLTGDTLEKKALEKQILELSKELEKARVENEFLRRKPFWKFWG